MIDTIKKDLLNGLKTFKFWAQTLSDRLKIEINIIKLLSEMRALEEKKNKLLIELGNLIYKSGKSTVSLSDDERILSLLREIKEVEYNVDSIKKKISDIGANF